MSRSWRRGSAPTGATRLARRAWTAREHVENVERILSDPQADDRMHEALRPVAPAPVAPGFDRTGMPPIHELARYEENAKLRFSPRRLRWKDVQALDEKAAEVEQ